MQGWDGSNGPRRFHHGGTNDTFQVGDEVVKEYTGPDAHRHADTEARVLRAVAAKLPVPAVRSIAGARLSFDFVPGRHAQDLLTPDTAGEILAACGRVLADIHAAPLSLVTEDKSVSGVLVHGDFGPNNILLAENSLNVAAVLDWEWAHPGEPLEDLAWCEWVVRTHHPDCVDALPHLHHGYGAAAAPWPQRRAAMLSKCRTFQAHARRRHDGTASMWQRRAAITAAWHVA
ncbi:MAG: phosphotransferase family protein [Stackebrandtia sp.]